MAKLQVKRQSEFTRILFLVNLENDPNDDPPLMDESRKVQAILNTRLPTELVFVRTPHDIEAALAKYDPADTFIFNWAENLPGWIEGGETATAMVDDDWAHTASNAGVQRLIFDRAQTYLFLREWGIPVPNFQLCYSESDCDTWQDYPALIRPNNVHGSESMSLVHSADDAKKTMANLRQKHQPPFILTQYIGSEDGSRKAREFSVMLLSDGQKIDVLPIAEMNMDALGHDFKDEHDKGVAGPTVEELNTCPAVLEPALQEKLTEWSREIFQNIGAKIYARWDFRMFADESDPICIDCNVEPEVCHESLCELIGKAAGMTFEQLILNILDRGMAYAHMLAATGEANMATNTQQMQRFNQGWKTIQSKGNVELQRMENYPGGVAKPTVSYRVLVDGKPGQDIASKDAALSEFNKLSGNRSVRSLSVGDVFRASQSAHGVISGKEYSIVNVGANLVTVQPTSGGATIDLDDAMFASVAGDSVARANAQMDTKEYNKLVSEYGKELADKAKTWFEENHSQDFARGVKQAEFVKSNEYLWRSKNPIEQLYRAIVGAFKPFLSDAKPIQRALDANELVKRIYECFAQMERQTLDPIDIFFERGQTFVLAADSGKLIRFNVDIDDSENVSLSHGIEISDTQRNQTRFRIIRQADGKVRWLAVAASAVINRQGEIDSTKLFDSFIERINRTHKYPILDFYHQRNKVRLGQADMVAREGVLYIASGTFDDTPVARAAIPTLEKNPQDWGLSISYVRTRPPQMIEVTRGVEIPVFTDGVNDFISVLPAKEACDLFTAIGITRGVNMNKKVREALLALTGDEKLVDEFAGQVDDTNRAVVDKRLITRAAKTIQRHGAYDKGQEDWLENPSATNPFVEGSDENEEWQAGFDDAASNAVSNGGAPQVASPEVPVQEQSAVKKPLAVRDVTPPDGLSPEDQAKWQSAYADAISSGMNDADAQAAANKAVGRSLRQGTKEYAEGKAAYAADPNSKNPYEAATPAYADWQRGFDEAKASIESKAQTGDIDASTYGTDELVIDGETMREIVRQISASPIFATLQKSIDQLTVKIASLETEERALKDDATKRLQKLELEEVAKQREWLNDLPRQTVAHSTIVRQRTPADAPKPRTAQDIANATLAKMPGPKLNQ